MKTLFYLWFLKTKANIRNLFKKPASAIFTILMILLYGFIFVSLFTIHNQTTMIVNYDLHSSILLIIAFLAMMLFSTMMTSKKALFFGEDAFYLFGGPFTRKQIMAYLTMQTIIQSLFIGLFALVFFAGISGGLEFNIGFIGLLLLCVFITIMIFLVLTDYLYVVSISDEKLKILPKVIIGVFIIAVMGVLIGTYLETGSLKTLMVDFIQSSLFYYVPVFGWLKLALIGYVMQDAMMSILGILLLVIGLIVIYALFINYKGDFYEQAIQDSLEYSKRYKSLKEGNQNAMKDVKVKTVHSRFYDGAYAVMSKNLILMKKTGHIISMSDLISIGIYVAVTIFSGLGFGFFVYMMIIWVFSSLQNSELATELKNYQIYLIPDKPLKKLIAVILPTFIKVCAVSILSFIVIGIYYQTDIMTLLMYIVNLLGYICVFISASVLTLRILKSRSSRLFENMMRMLIMIVCALPSVILTTYFILAGSMNTTMFMIVSYSSLVLNFIVSGVILLSCQNMMNGRELKSE
ncbi:putative ABC exporter domain-containing protein [Candidatus Stoquefichus massiliensis]|uniref:putative ABC exporter domain-containing protein n=1 Tax=Candidatus Stoquefichus massiliensis TaxID=1470350 RepID=UPI0004861FFD|nr:putative ABC exporter domain-containing protein [Candidatus Stoquefichus massiliensis]